MQIGLSDLLKLTGAQLKHGNLGRAAFVCWMSVPPYLMMASWALLSQIAIPEAGESGLTLIALFSLCAAMMLCILALSSLHPALSTRPLIYAHIVLWFYGFLAVTSCYLLGTLNLLTGLIMMAAPTIGLILFPARLIATIFSISLVALLVLSALAATNIIAYAPGLGIGADFSPDESLYFTASMILAASGYVAYQTVIVLTLLNAWRTREEAVRQQSATDPLTGVANRRYVLEHLNNAMHGTRRSDRMALLMLDIDHFKHINDKHGHQTGDEALVRVAEMLRQCVREQDLVGRYGGEEFLVVLPGTDQHAATEIAERCRKAVSSVRVSMSGEAVAMTISVGVVSRILQDDSHMDDLIRLADDAMYRAKKAGRNCVIAG